MNLSTFIFKIIVFEMCDINKLALPTIAKSLYIIFIYIIHYCSKVSVHYAHSGSIYLIKNAVKAVILWNIITI